MRIEGLLRIVELARLKGTVFDGIFFINGKMCKIEGMESGADVVFRLQGPVDMPDLGIVPVGNLDYFQKVLVQFKGVEVEILRDQENMLTISYEKRPWRFQLADEERGIKHKLDDPSIIDEVIGEEAFFFPLPEHTRSECAKYLSVLESQKVYFFIDKDGSVSLNGGGEQESSFDYYLGKGKPQKKEYCFDVRKEKLIAILDSLDYPEAIEEKGKKKLIRNPTLGFRLAIEDRPIAIFKQLSNIWLLTSTE